MSNKTIKNATDEELQFELKSRKVARIAQARADREQRISALCKCLSTTPELLDILAPNHCRTSCADDSPWINGQSGLANPPRCIRCALILLQKHGEEELVEPYTINVTIDKANLG